MPRLHPFLITLLMAINPLFTVNAGESDFAEPPKRTLWDQGAPGATGEKTADQPVVWIYPAENPNGAAVVICPGGGYGIHAVDHEGVQPARFLNRMGVSAFVLRYRLSPYRHPWPLKDAQRAIRWVRAHAEEFSADPQRVGIMGFSAGGHLAATASTHFDPGNRESADPVDRESCRPSFTILGYPVASFAPDITHGGSVRNLLGPEPNTALRDNLTNELQVTAETPPAFLFHTQEDQAVPAANSTRYFSALTAAGVPAELHVYQDGPHGAGLASGHPAAERWMHLAGTWLQQNKFLTPLSRHAISGRIQLDGTPLAWGTIAFKSDDRNLPVGWTMVRRGNYRLDERLGLVPGRYHVQVVSMGQVAPQPTADDLSKVSPSGLTVEVPPEAGPSPLEFHFNLSSAR